MRDNVYSITEVVGSSTEGQDDAIRQAIARTAKSIGELHWFEVTECRGFIEDGDVAYWQVTLRIGARLPAAGALDALDALEQQGLIERHRSSRAPDLPET